MTNAFYSVCACMCTCLSNKATTFIHCKVVVSGENDSISWQGVLVFCCIVVEGRDKIVLKPACTLGTWRIVLEDDEYEKPKWYFQNIKNGNMDDTEIIESKKWLGEFCSYHVPGQTGQRGRKARMKPIVV